MKRNRDGQWRRDVREGRSGEKRGKGENAGWGEKDDKDMRGKRREVGPLEERKRRYLTERRERLGR